MNAVLKPSFPPGPHRRYPGEIFLKLQQNPPQTLTRLAQQGPVVGLKVGSFRAILISRPELIHQVLVREAGNYSKGPGHKALKRLLGNGLLTSEGDLHKSQRQFLQPVFQAQKVASFVPEIVGCSEYLLKKWPENGVIGASSEMTRFTMQVVGECLFGTDLESDVGEVRAALGDAMGLFRVANLPFASWLEKLYPPLRQRLSATRQRLDAVVFRMIEAHRSCPHQDLLARMMGSPMSEELLRDESMTIFLAGHETTAHALTFALYLLARHPEVQSQLRQEIAQLCPDGRLQFEHLARMHKTRDALQETLRLYPPAWIMARQALRETSLGGFLVPQGCLILMSQFVMHRQADNFPEPERFRPERWRERPRAQLPKGSFFPFGMGPRICIGEHFAWLEMLLGLGTILQQYELVDCPVAEPRLRTRVTMSPAQELPVTVKRL